MPKSMLGCTSSRRSVKTVHTLYTYPKQPRFFVIAHMIQSFEFCVSQACCLAGSTLRGLPLRKSHSIARRSKPPVMQLAVRGTWGDTWRIIPGLGYVANNHGW